MLRILLSILAIHFALSMTAQVNSILTDQIRNYDQGLRFLKDENYSQALAYFEKFSNQNFPSSQYNQVQGFLSESEYYQAIIHAKLKSKDADKKLIALYQSAHSARKNHLAYYLGNYYFDLENYKDAESWYATIDEKSLQSEWLDDFYFHSGYVAMENNKDNVALGYFDKNLKIKNSNHINDAYYYSGVIFFNKKDYENAEKYLTSIRNSSQTKGTNFVMAQLQFLKKNYPEVIKLLENESTNPAGKNQLLGKSYFELKEYKQAENYLQRHVSATPKVSAEDMYQLAYSEYKSGNFKVAIDHFRELQLSNNFGQFAMYALADCYLRAQDKQNALNAFMQASQLEQDKVITEESKFSIAKLNYELKNYNQATTNLFEFTDKYPNSIHDREAWELLTQSLLNTNNYPQVIGIIEKNAKLQEGNERLYQEICYAHAVNANNSGDTAIALKFLKKSILNPFDRPIEAEAHYLKADILYKSGNIDEAMKSYTEAFKVVTKDKLFMNQNATLFNIHYGLGYCEYTRKNYDAALSQFQNAAKNYKLSQSEPVSNTMQDVDLRIADIYFLQKKFQQAYDYYSKVSLRRGQGYDYATLQKANIDGVKKNFKDKISTLSKLMKEVPNSVYYNDAHYQLGLAYEDDKNFDMAIKTYEDIEKNSNSQEYIPKSLVRLATIYYNNQNPLIALKKYQAIAENYTTSPEADQAFKAIKEIYISQGKPDEYLNYMSKLPNSYQLSNSEQDSMLFYAGEELFATQNYDNAIILFNKYLDKFPKGIFSAKAHFLKAESYSAKKMYVEAVEEYNYLAQENNNPYYERAVVKSAYFSYNTQKDFSKAKTFYQKLLAVASSMQNKQVAKIGLLESNYNLKNYAEVIEISKLIESDADISTEIKNDAYYYKAKSYFFTKAHKLAIPMLENLVKDKSSKRSAECTYYLASIYHQQGEYKKSNEILQKAKDEYGSYEYWVIKYFILIGYNHHKLGDNFQAKATLESIVNNYQGDENLMKEARDKLAEVTSNIKTNSKVKYK